MPKQGREVVVVDWDAMGQLIDGKQEGRHFKASYGDYCWLPLPVLVDDAPLWAQFVH